MLKKLLKKNLNKIILYKVNAPARNRTNKD